MDDADVGGGLLQQVAALQDRCDAVPCRVGSARGIVCGSAHSPRLRAAGACARAVGAAPALSAPRLQRSRRNTRLLPSSASASRRMRSCRSSTYCSKAAKSPPLLPAAPGAAACCAADAEAAAILGARTVCGTRGLLPKAPAALGTRMIAPCLCDSAIAAAKGGGVRTQPGPDRSRRQYSNGLSNTSRKISYNVNSLAVEHTDPRHRQVESFAGLTGSPRGVAGVCGS